MLHHAAENGHNIERLAWDISEEQEDPSGMRRNSYSDVSLHSLIKCNQMSTRTDASRHFWTKLFYKLAEGMGD